MDFRLKQIQFFQRDVMIVCQNENGPCPLLAIANVLSLQGKLEISSDMSFISLDALTQLVANQVLQHYEQTSEGVQPQHMNAILHVLPGMVKGLDLNVSFNGVDKYEFTEEITIFDALNIPLLHGWLYDPFREGDVEAAIASQSYNHIMFKMIEYRTLVERIQSEYASKSGEEINASVTEEQRVLLRDGRVIDDFLRRSASQLTYHGIVKLYEFLNDRQLAVFFRNNHFSTMFFYNGQLFLLMTDMGYVDQPHVVWELLENVKGGSEFYNSEFVPLRDLKLPELANDNPTAITDAAGGTVASPPLLEGVAGNEASSHSPESQQTNNPLHDVAIPVEADQDYILAMQMQMQEEAVSNSPPPPPAFNQEYGMSQDELDHQTAIMMQYEVNRQAQQNSRRKRGAPRNTAVRVEHPNYEGQDNYCSTGVVGDGSKSTACTIC